MLKKITQENQNLQLQFIGPLDKLAIIFTAQQTVFINKKKTFQGMYFSN